jgi:hypothetical protein
LLKKTRLVIALSVVTTACSGSGGSRDLPATPLAPSETNDIGLTAPSIDSPSDNGQLNTLRPTLTVNNATASESGARSYEFQIADNSGFTLTAGRTSTVAYSQAGIPEGSNGKTSLTVPGDLLPTTTYYWRARALQGSAIGPWSQTSRFRTRQESFKSGNRVFDLLTDGETVADLQENISFFPTSDRDPGAKLNGDESFLGYRISTLAEGEVSFIARRIKATGDDDYIGATRIFTMQNGTGSLTSNPYRVIVDRHWNSGRIRFEFHTPGGGNAAQTGGMSWTDHRPYLFKIEWRGGTARLRVFDGSNESARTKVDLSVTYGGSYNPGNQVVVAGSMHNDTLKDMRVSSLWIGSTPRP